MKKSGFILSVLVTLTLTSNGCNEPKVESKTITSTEVAVEESKKEPNAGASIVGTWKLFDVDLGMVAPKGKEKVYEDLKKDMIAKTVYTFGDDKALIMESPMGKVSGTYSVKGNILTTVVNKQTDSVTIQSLTANELILVAESRGIKTVMKFKK